VKQSCRSNWWNEPNSYSQQTKQNSSGSWQSWRATKSVSKLREQYDIISGWDWSGRHRLMFPNWNLTTFYVSLQHVFSHLHLQLLDLQLRLSFRFIVNFLHKFKFLLLSVSLLQYHLFYTLFQIFDLSLQITNFKWRPTHFSYLLILFFQLALFY
jgi:hypothetical protein